MIDQAALEAKFERHKHLLPMFAQTLPPAQWPALDKHARLDRAKGCLLGLAVGEARTSGEWRDATAMALSLGQSLIASETVDQYDFMTRLQGWLHDGENTPHGKCTDIGTTTKAAIESFMADDEPAAGPVDGTSAGNGSLTRLAPLAIFCASNIDQAQFFASKQSRTTHGTIECINACELFTAQLVDALNGADKATATRPRVMQLSPNTLAINGGEWKQKSREQIKATAYVIDTLEAALWAVGHTDNFRAAVELAADIGGNVTGIGAVAGQLAGALYGATAIPAQWLELLALREKIEGLGAQLMTAATTATGA